MGPCSHRSFIVVIVVTEGTITACEGGNALVDVVKITFGLVTGLL
jgi:hypothetical protein